MEILQLFTLHAAWQNTVPIPDAQAYVIEHEGMSAYGTFTDKVMADNGWQSFLQRIMESDEPGAEHVSSSLLTGLQT